MATRAAAKTTTDQGTDETPAESAPVTPSLSIFERINAISKEAGALAPESKGGVPFAFRGVDGTVAHLTPFMHKYGVFVTPTAINHIVTEREVADKQGNPTGRVVKTTQVETTFGVFGPDGFGFNIQTAGLADDFADRSTAQAQSVAYRVALLQLFHLPTHEREPEQNGEAVQAGIAEANAGTGRSAKAVETAKAASVAPAATPVSRLQQEAKALGRKLGKEPAELNAKGEDLSGGAKQEEWFNDAGVMTALVKWLKDEEAAASA